MEMWFSEFHTPDVKHSIRVNRQLYSKQSDYQRIDIFETPEFGRVLTLDGNVMLTERDEFIYDEMITHVPMSVHKNAKDILVIGAGDGGVVRELTRYDRVERIDLVEMDPQVIEACRAYLPGNACRMDDRRVHIYYENALKFIRKCEDEYDLIIVDSSDPFGPSEGLFTREFYGSCFNALRADGIMVNQQGSPFYAEDATAMQRSHQRIASTFPISKVYQAHIPTFAAGYWLFGFASKKYHPINDMDADAWNALNMRTRYYTSRLHVGAFYLPAFLEEMLREDGIMVNQQGSPFYRHDAEAMQRSHQRIIKLFPVSRVYQAHIPTYAAGYWLFGFASKKYHPIDDFDEERWKSRNLETDYYTPRLHKGSFYLPAFLEKMLMEVEE